MSVHEILLALVLLDRAEPPPPPPPPTPEARFEEGFKAGQDLYEARRYLEAARTWVDAASRLPEVTANREHRAAIFEYIADAYLRGLPTKDRAFVLREAIDALDAYCDGFRHAYGAETPINPKVLQVQYELRRQLEEHPEPGAPVEPAWTPPPPEARPWKGLVVGGGVLAGFGAGAAIFAGVMGARGDRLEADFEAAKCSLHTPTPSCSDLIAQGRAANKLAIGGAIVAPLALGGGVALLLVGARRKSATRYSLAPVFTPTYAGVSLTWKWPRLLGHDAGSALSRRRNRGSVGE